MTNDRTLSGSIVLVKGTSWISQQIILHLKIWAKLKHKTPLPYSHGETLVWHDGTLWTIGARESGAEISKAVDYYKGKTYLVLKPVRQLSVMEEQYLWTFWTYVDKTKYQYSNLVSWLQYIKTFGLIYIGRRGAQTTYCYELCARFADFIHRWKGSLDTVSSYDLYENPNYKEYATI